MPNLELNCGDDPSHIFTIEIADTKNITALKKAIKDEKQPAFDHVPADTLIIWRVSFPVDEGLEENLRDFVAGKALSPVNKLSKVFANVRLHVIVGCPPGACRCNSLAIAHLEFSAVAYQSVTSELLPLLELNCLVHSEPRASIFPVKMPAMETIGSLKESHQG
jgi:hypothetical protein